MATTTNATTGATSALLDKMRRDLLNTAVEELISKQDDAMRLPYGLMQSVLADLKKSGIETDRNHLNYLKRKRMDEMKKEKEIAEQVLTNAPVNEVIWGGAGDSQHHNTCISSLSGEQELAGGTNIATTTTTTTTSITSGYNSSNRTSKTSSGSGGAGRPAGTSIAAQKEMKKRKMACLNEVAKLYQTELEKREEAGCSKTKKNYLNKLIEDKWTEYNLDANDIVSTNTIRSRIQRNNPETFQRAGVAPILPKDVEDTIVTVILEMAKIREPLSVTESIALANSMIKRTKLHEKVVAWKKRRNPDLPDDDEYNENFTLGVAWWRGFRKRYEDVLVTKKGEKFASDRSDWSTEPKIKQMYDVIYRNLEAAGVAKKLDVPVYMNAEGEVVDNEDNVLNFAIEKNNPFAPLGLICEYELVHPEYVVFFDETGCNTNQKKDGHFGGQKYVCRRGMTPKMTSATKDKHFTVLGLTAATGEPILCVVIFSSEKKDGVAADWAQGIDIMLDPVKNDEGEIILSGVNFGDGKYFPGGPTCVFRGKTINYLPLASSSGGITGELLVEILRYLDMLEVYERNEGGPVPLLIVDGHDSRMSPEFVDYVTDPNHIWKVNFGIPHATSYWQVGDSLEQNGHFKMLLGKSKSELVQFKIAHNITPIGLSGSDIIPIVNKAWYPTFGNVVTNKKAIALRGWNPLNRNLLLHPEIKGNGTSTASETDEDEILNSFNVTDGISGRCFERIVQSLLRNGGRIRNQENLRHGETILETYNKAKRMSKSLLIRRQIHEINDPEVVNLFKINSDKQKEVEKQAVRKRRRELRQRIEKVQQLRLTKPNRDLWNMKDCRDYVQYKKVKGDPKMPSTLPLLLQRCRELDGRASPDCSVHDSDDDDDEHQVIFDDVAASGNDLATTYQFVGEEDQGENIEI